MSNVAGGIPNVAADLQYLQSAASVKLGFVILSIRITNPAITEFRIANHECSEEFF
jgi:hypothetical protein